MADQMLKEVQQWLNSTYGNRSDFPKVPEDGAADVSNSRYLTYRGLVRALQIEIGGITVDGDFGISTQNACPNISQVADVDTATPNNFHYIVQGGLINKGYDPQAFSGIFGPKTAAAVKEFQSDAGVEQTGIATGWLLKGLLNTDSYTLTSNGNANYREVARTLNQYYAPQIGLTATNSEWERKMHQNLIKACQIEWGVNADGVFGTGTMNAAPTLSQSKSGYTASKRLLQCALTVNGYWPGGISGTFGSGTYQAVYDFQDFACLGADGVAGKNTWASLLKSTGNPDRTAKAIDTAVRVDAAFAQQIKGFNFDTVGRYLTNATEIDGHLDKKMTVEEIEVLANAGLKVFPIFQTSGDKIEYFTATRGKNDGVTAKSAAVRLGFPTGTTIYFAVDYDVRNTEIDSIVAYARAAKIGLAGKYKLGIYGPRYVCQTLCDKGISDYSFVSDLSSGFEGNIGHKLPDNWAYDQIKETTIYGKGVDKCVASPRATGVLASNLNPQQSGNVDYTEGAIPGTPLYTLNSDNISLNSHNLDLSSYDNALSYTISKQAGLDKITRESSLLPLEYNVVTECAEELNNYACLKLKSNSDLPLPSNRNVFGRYIFGSEIIGLPDGKHERTSELCGKEIEMMKTIGDIYLYPIYQYPSKKSTEIEYFDEENKGLHDAIRASEAAKLLGFPKGTIIYFAVDLDAWDIPGSNDILEKYFTDIHDYLIDTNYKPGVYCGRRTGKFLYEKGLTDGTLVEAGATGWSEDKNADGSRASNPPNTMYIKVKDVYVPWDESAWIKLQEVYNIAYGEVYDEVINNWSEAYNAGMQAVKDYYDDPNRNKRIIECSIGFGTAIAEPTPVSNIMPVCDGE